MKLQPHRHHTIRHEQWHWPIEITSYDRHALLYPAKQEELAKLIEHMDGKHNHWPHQARTMLHRLVSLLEAALDVSDLQGKLRTAIMLILLQHMHHLQRSLWGWSSREWFEVLCKSNVEFHQRYTQPASSYGTTLSEARRCADSCRANPEPVGNGEARAKDSHIY